MPTARRALRLFLLLVCCALTGAARAQLAQSFYTLTKIETRQLPNAIQTTIQADGSLNLGIDYLDFYEPDPNRTGDYRLKTVRKFRLRFKGARSRVPAFTDIGTYPIDSAQISLARTRLGAAFFETDDDIDPSDQSTIALDVEMRFFIPVKVAYFTFRFGRDYGWNEGETGNFRPGEVTIVLSPDKRSVVITAYTDRAETLRTAQRLNRSPFAERHHHLDVTPVRAAVGESPRLRVDALHAPLTDFASAVTSATGVPLVVQPDATDADVSLFLPSADASGIARALEAGPGLAVEPRAPNDGGGYTLGRGGGAQVTERVPLRYLPPENARLLFPDFLLPNLRADIDGNTLVVTGSVRLVEKLRRDLALLDVPRPQIRVQAEVYEITHDDDLDYFLKGEFASGKQAFDTETGMVSTLLVTGQEQTYRLQLQALQARGRARLTEKPFVVIRSGETANLFSGQTRFLQVLRQQNGSQNATILPLPVGVTLNVTPTTAGRADDWLTLELAPRFATVDAIDPDTRQPTLGIREVRGAVRVRNNDQVLIGGLQSESNESTRRYFGPFRRIPVLRDLFGASRRVKNRTSLIILVSAQLVETSTARVPVPLLASPVP